MAFCCCFYFEALSIIEKLLPASSREAAISKMEITAGLKAEAEYEVFRVTQDREYVSDFDREIKRLEGRSTRC